MPSRSPKTEPGSSRALSTCDSQQLGFRGILPLSVHHLSPISSHLLPIPHLSTTHSLPSLALDWSGFLLPFPLPPLSHLVFHTPLGFIVTLFLSISHPFLIHRIISPPLWTSFGSIAFLPRLLQTRLISTNKHLVVVMGNRTRLPFVLLASYMAAETAHNPAHAFPLNPHSVSRMESHKLPFYLQTNSVLKENSCLSPGLQEPLSSCCHSCYLQALLQLRLHPIHQHKKARQSQ